MRNVKVFSKLIKIMKIAKHESFCQIFRVFFDMRKLIPLKVFALKVHNSVQVFSLINCVPLSIVVHSLSSLCNTSNNRNETNPAFYFGVLLNNYSFFIYIYTKVVIFNNKIQLYHPIVVHNFNSPFVTVGFL